MTLQDAGYGYTYYDPSFARAADWLLAPSATARTRTVRVMTKDPVKSVDSADSTRHALGYEDQSGFSKHALEERVKAGKLPYTVHETIYESDATKRSASLKLESKVEIRAAAGHLQGVVYVYHMPGTGHYDVRNTTTGALAKGRFGEGDKFAATGPATLTALKPGKYMVVDSQPLVRKDDNLAHTKLAGKQPALVPSLGPVEVTEFQHGPGYEVFARVKDVGWTLLSNLKPAP